MILFARNLTEKAEYFSSEKLITSAHPQRSKSTGGLRSAALALWILTAFYPSLGRAENKSVDFGWSQGAPQGRKPLSNQRENQSSLSQSFEARHLPDSDTAYFWSGQKHLEYLTITISKKRSITVESTRQNSLASKGGMIRVNLSW